MPSSTADRTTSEPQGLTGAAREVAQAAREKLNEVREAAGEYYEQGIQKARELEESLESRIRENPFRAVLIAAGVAAGAGLIIGLWIRR
jgi:ElaB/YqjD/DUF883 family membrane-anchored ribosome-binding protein